MEKLSQLKERFAAMPWPFRLLVVASLFIGIVFSFMPLVPGSTFGFNKRELSYSELWATRVALAVIAVGLLMLVLGVALFLRKTWVRPMLVVLPLLQTLPFLAVHWAFGAPNPVDSPAYFAGSTAAWALVAAVYLYGTRNGREHFANADCVGQEPTT